MYDEHGVATPRIEELAKHGVIYDHAFSNAPVCSVARTTLATGCYGPRIGTQYHRRTELVPMPDGLSMFPAYLRQAGYYTTNNSKKDYNAIEGKNVWDASSKKANWRQRKKGQPFFHMQSFTTSHEGRLHFSQKSMETDATITDPESVFVAPYHPNTPTFRYTNAKYRDQIQRVDQEIGAVVDRLSQDGLLDDTFVFYFGDHGGVLPRGKGYAYESGLHVPLVVRIPENWKHLVDEKLGSHQSGFVSFIDFGPTVLNLAGIDVPKQMDGVPFLGSSVKSAAVAERNEAFNYADRFDEKYDFVRTLRIGRYEYVRSYQPFNFDGLQNNYRYRMLAFKEWRDLYDAGKLNAEQRQFFEQRPAEMLFDIESDPHEVKNLADDPAHAETLIKMRSRLSEMVKSLPDLSFFPESVLVDEAFDNPVKYGRTHREEISRMVDIANLQLGSFADVEGELKRALKSDEPWERYWGLIVCSSFGESAKSMVPLAKTLAETDKTALNRIRAAEFLALIGEADPERVFRQALAESESGVEANLMLNSLVLLRDGQRKHKFDFKPEVLKPSVLRNPELKRRLEYLEPKISK